MYTAVKLTGAPLAANAPLVGFGVTICCWPKAAPATSKQRDPISTDSD